MAWASIVSEKLNTCRFRADDTGGHWQVAGRARGPLQVVRCNGDGNRLVNASRISLIGRKSAIKMVVLLMVCAILREIGPHVEIQSIMIFALTVDSAEVGQKRKISWDWNTAGFLVRSMYLLVSQVYDNCSNLVRIKGTLDWEKIHTRLGGNYPFIQKHIRTVL